MTECTDPKMRELLHGYELNQLNETDRDHFEEHLLSCESCVTEVAEMQPLAMALTANRAALLSALREDGLTFDQIRRRLTAHHERWWTKFSALFGNLYGQAALAGGLAVIILLVVLMRSQPGVSPYLSDLSYELPPYQTGLELRGEARDQASVVFELAMKSYSEGNYPVAIDGIERALELDPKQPDRWLYLGVSQYATHDAKHAMQSLKKADEGDGLTKIRARWYMAQTYLYLNKSDEAQPLLEWLVAQNSEHADDAERLLVTLKAYETRK